MANIPKLKNDFNSILRLRTELHTKRDILTEKIDEIREQYNELIKTNSKKIYLYCLDSLFFQYKILRVELEQFQKTISLIFNRMYGDYYKLYNIIQSQCKENSTNILLSGESVLVYKDLDPFAEYSLDDLVLTHKIIIDTLTKLHVLYSSKQDEINDYNTNMRIGFSVTSFISTLSYENKILGEHISLYSDYLSFYHSSQRNYFEKALYKINGFMREIEEDVLTNHKPCKTEIVESIVNLVKPVMGEPIILIEEIIPTEPIQAESEIIESEIIESRIKTRGCKTRGYKTRRIVPTGRTKDRNRRRRFPDSRKR
jgi:hypothetical protein